MARSGGEGHARADRLNQLADEEDHVGDAHFRVAALLLRLQLVHDPGEQQDRQQHGVGDLPPRLHGAVEHLQHLPEVRGLVAGDGAVDLRQERLEQRRVHHQPEGAARPAAPQQLQDLLRHARRRGFQDLVAVPQKSRVRPLLDGEFEAGGEFDGAHHPHRVFPEADVGFADDADVLRLHVGEALDVVDHREVGNVVEEGVDGEVAPPRVLQRRAEGVVVGDEEVFRLFVRGAPFRLTPEGGHFHDHVLKDDVHETEAAADDPAVAEQAPDLGRMGVRGDVEVLRRAVGEQVADAAAAEIGAVAAAVQAVENLEDVLRNAAPGDGVGAPVDDLRVDGIGRRKGVVVRSRNRFFRQREGRGCLGVIAHRVIESLRVRAHLRPRSSRTAARRDSGSGCRR